jgi:uncharacterized protein involved in tellurium resistance
MAINLNKIVLEKKGDVSRFKLNKESNAGLAPKEISINLNWEKKQNQTGSGLFSSFKKLLGNSDEIDLDLGCF